MKNIVFALFALVFATATAFGQGQQQQIQTISTDKMTVTTGEQRVQVVLEPVRKNVTTNVAVPKKPVKRNPNVTYQRRTTQVTTGYTGYAVIPAQTYEVQGGITATQVQQQMAPMQDNLDNLGARVESLENNQEKIVQGVNRLGVRVTALEDDMTQVNANFQAMNGRLVSNETLAQEAYRIAKSKPGRLETIAWGFGGGFVGGLLSRVIFPGNSNSNTNVNNPGWNPGWNGGGGTKNCRNNNGLWAGYGCYNQPVGGDCRVRGNCNYNTNPNGSGPVSVRNGSGSYNGNFGNSNNTSRRDYGTNYGSTSNSNGNYYFSNSGSTYGTTTNNGGGTYNSPVSSGNGTRRY